MALPVSTQPSVEQIEMDLLLEAIYQRWGYDFRSYARASLERRATQFLARSGCSSIGELIPRVLRDASLFSSLVRSFSVSVTELFRDPAVYLALREEVVPLLRTWPHIKVWHAGCATGEEVYSLAIVLTEEDLYERATIYATDFNDEALESARRGIYEISRLSDASRGYQLAGGKSSLANYYHACYGAAAMDASLRRRIVFSSHNLATDATFGEMHLILCRNVLIYFNRELQDRVIGLFTQSLVRGGFLCLGTKEDLRFSARGSSYETVNPTARLYRSRGAEDAAGTRERAGEIVNARSEVREPPFVILAGGSAGACDALEVILAVLPASFGLPILVVQHLHPTDGGAFARRLSEISPLPVVEARDKAPVRAGCVHAAPANYHMLVERDGTIGLCVDEKVNWSRPSIDVLFESAARVWGSFAVAVLLSGASEDGVEGLRAVRAAGGRTIVQDPVTARYPVMPGRAVEEGVADEVLSPGQIGARLAALDRDARATGCLAAGRPEDAK